nr:hypothetical protein [Tanacetum cinerariifolium]GEW16799.1 hypothetical protein [Tanacetum cinerariifolium]
MDPPPPPRNYLQLIPSEVVPLIFSFSDLPEVVSLRSTNSYFNTLTREEYFAQVFNNRENPPVWIFGHRLTQEHPHLGVIYGIRLHDGRRMTSPVKRSAEWGDIDIETATLQDVSGCNILLYLEPDHNLVVVNPFSGTSRFISLHTFFPIVFELPRYFTILSNGDDFLVECMLIDEVDSDTYLSYHSRHPNWREVDTPYNTIDRLRHVRFDRTMNMFSEMTGELHTIHIRGDDENAEVFRVAFPLEDLYYSDSDEDEDALRYNYVLFGNCILTYTTRELFDDLCIVEAFWVSFRYSNIFFDYHRRVPGHLLTRTPILLNSVSAYQVDDVVYIQFSSDAVEALGTVAEINVYRYQEETPEPWTRATFNPIAGNAHTGAFFTTRLTLPLPNNID